MTNHNPLVTIVIFGGSELQKKEMINKITNLYPVSGDYDLVLVTNKKAFNQGELYNSLPLRVLGMNKGMNSVQQISSKVLNVCNTNYFIFQNVNEELFNIKKFIEVIRKSKQRNDTLIAFTAPVKKKEKCIVEDVPLLFCEKDISNIAFPRAVLKHSNESVDQYEWKINSIINTKFVSINPVKFEDINFENPSSYFQNVNEQIKKFLNLINKISLNKYVKHTLTKNIYEQIISNQVGVMFKKIIKETKGNEQVVFLNEFYTWLKEIDIQVLSSIPSIRYYFIRWSIDNYFSFSYSAKRKHISIVKYIVNNMHYDDHQIFMEKYNKMYPAAISTAKYSSIIPIYLYLAKRKLSKKLEQKENSKITLGMSINKDA